MTPDNASAGGLAALQRAASPTAIPLQPYPWKQRLLAPGLIVLALGATAAWAARDALLPATLVKVVPVLPRTGPVEGPAGGGGVGGDRGGVAGNGAVVAQAAGWVEPDPYPIAATALADGIVREVLILEGAPVKAGEVLVRLVDDDAKLAVSRAQAELAVRTAQLRAAEATWEHPFERDHTLAAAKADLELAAAERVRVEAEIAAESARAEELADILARLEKRNMSGVASEVEMVNTRYRLQAQRAVVEAARARVPMLAAAVRKREAGVAAAAEGRERRIEETQALEGARAAVALAEADLAEARLRLARMEVRSPAEGVVMNRLVEPGSKLMLSMDAPGSAVVARLYDPRKLQVRVDVPLADAAKVGVGMRCQIVAEVLPDRRFTGEVVRAVHEADSTRNTLQFKVRIEDPAAQLKPEMLARVRFLGGGANGLRGRAGGWEGVAGEGSGGQTAGGMALFVPEGLLQRDGRGEYVLVANRREHRAQRRTVTRGTAQRDGWILIAQGLVHGDELVAEPEGVRDGQRIRIGGELAARPGPGAGDGRER